MKYGDRAAGHVWPALGSEDLVEPITRLVGEHRTKGRANRHDGGTQKDGEKAESPGFHA